MNMKYEPINILDRNLKICWQMNVLEKGKKKILHLLVAT